jgi:hypothetical protein
MIAVIEAVVGQFYVAVIVALLVSRFVAPTLSSSVTGDARPRAIE